jgi:hypothetical protein
MGRSVNPSPGLSWALRALPGEIPHVDTAIVPRSVGDDADVALNGAGNLVRWVRVASVHADQAIWWRRGEMYPFGTRPPLDRALTTHPHRGFLERFTVGAGDET